MSLWVKFKSNGLSNGQAKPHISQYEQPCLQLSPKNIRV
jgi:hypothetical protein